jgi:hypothetical protein
MNQQDKDFDYFLENMENLYHTHGQKFVVVKNMGILGVYNDFNEALENTIKTEELGTFLIQECFDNKGKMVHHFQGNVTPVPV